MYVELKTFIWNSFTLCFANSVLFAIKSFRAFCNRVTREDALYEDNVRALSITERKGDYHTVDEEGAADENCESCLSTAMSFSLPDVSEMTSFSVVKQNIWQRTAVLLLVTGFPPG